ncbi:hypothetical protein UWK_00274 [Desulfocapsa sulfexigens DSM 10523]|uniref:Uncharacterized protein n=1 Tax=Desulfocapsa sulfexigens (strain DSM 10523 / SB164P1) TaxID=1167006 RepID=M1NAI6_DESSD|nr:hypothetical protein UWK_00274 [Desulfocapsa sulfexigens DSM 10523]
MQLGFGRCQNCGLAAIRNPRYGSARCHDNRDTIVPSCFRQGDYFYDYDLCDGPSTL